MREAVHYVPIATSVVALVFAVVLGRRYRERGGTHLAWWCAGMVVYAAGTITESITTLFGGSEPVFKAWYISGALLGGAPLAQGTAYLLLSRRTATGWRSRWGPSCWSPPSRWCSPRSASSWWSPTACRAGSSAGPGSAASAPSSTSTR